MAKMLKVGTIGLPEDETRQLQTLYGLIRNDLHHDALWADGWASDVLMIDDDSIYGHMDWLKAQNMGKTVISITTREPREHEVVLRRPYTRDGVLASVRAACAQALGQEPPASATAPVRKTGEIPSVKLPAAANTTVITGENPAVVTPVRRTGEQMAVPAAPIRRTNEQAAVPATPIRRTGEQAAVMMPANVGEVVGVAPVAPAPVAPSAPALPRNVIELLASGRIHRATKLVRPGQPALILDPVNDRYFGPAAVKPLAEIFSAPLSLADWVDASDSEINELPSDVKAHNGARLLWAIAISNSHGKLHAGLDQNAKYKLSRWPQIEREFPKHFRIATVLMKAPASISEIADQSGASIGEVNDFINAYAAAGIAIPESTASIDASFNALAQKLAERLAG